MSKTTKRSRKYLAIKWAQQHTKLLSGELERQIFADSIMSPCTMVKFTEEGEPRLIPTGSKEWWDNYEKLKLERE